jgi:hypothetical protein
MQSTLNPKNPKQTDPRDVFMVEPEIVPVAHGEHDYSDQAQAYDGQAFDGKGRPRAHMDSGFSAGPSVPPVDTTFRATDVNNVRRTGYRPSFGVRAVRAVIGFLLAVCIGVAGALWQSYGDIAKAMVAKWTPQFAALSSSSPPPPPPDNAAAAEQPGPSAVPPSATTTASSQAAPPASSVADSAVPAAAASSQEPESAQLQSMAQDLVTQRQEIEQLKTTIAQLKASQDQMSRDVARVSEQSVRPRISALPPRPAAAPVRRPMPPPLRPSQAAAYPVSPQAAPYPVSPQAVPRQIEPLPPAQPQVQPQTSSSLRPPMPVPQ